jgi:hypothetical protein
MDNGPALAGLPAWPDLATRLTRAPFVIIAEIRSRAHGTAEGMGGSTGAAWAGAVVRSNW